VKTILIMAGGTGGHVFPGLAVADEMRGRGWNVVWMGARSGIEARLVPARGYPVEWIRAFALRGKGLAAKLLLPLNLLIGFWQSARTIFRVRPDVVLGMGGYVAFPGGMMASLLARPLAVHEQNAIAGLTNRVLAGVADKALVAFPHALKNAEWTGNPVRAEIAAIAARRAFRRPQGHCACWWSAAASARRRSTRRAEGARLFAEDAPVGHAPGGEKHLRILKTNYSRRRSGELVAFIDDMARAYAEADLVICRAGAMTIAELSAAAWRACWCLSRTRWTTTRRANARFLADRGGDPAAAGKLTPEVPGRSHPVARSQGAPGDGGKSESARQTRGRARRRRPLRGAGGMKHKLRRIHFVGIGGSGMSGIAEVLLNLGSR
jgi:UDP-N-acetylglucosamine--N-acetylmuramyl-(pentapeptide) pyrophosphoryl-undecaprenol N-acetylglucosamine transferase